MLNWKQIISRSFCVFSFLMPVVAFSSGQIGFESGEHFAAGDKVKLYFGNNDIGQSNYALHLANGLTLNYAQLIALSGDFYGVPGQTISEGDSFKERKVRFVEAYKT